MERRRNRCRLHFFPILDIWSSSGDIRNQSRKLSNIALNFGRFFALPNFRGPAFQKLYTYFDPCLAARSMDNACEDTPTSPEVIVANTLNFKANFKFSRMNFFLGGGDPRSTSGVRYQGLGNL